MAWTVGRRTGPTRGWAAHRAGSRATRGAPAGAVRPAGPDGHRGPQAPRTLPRQARAPNRRVEAAARCEGTPAADRGVRGLRPSANPVHPALLQRSGRGRQAPSARTASARTGWARLRQTWRRASRRQRPEEQARPTQDGPRAGSAFRARSHRGAWVRAAASRARAVRPPHDGHVGPRRPTAVPGARSAGQAAVRPRTRGAMAPQPTARRRAASRREPGRHPRGTRARTQRGVRRPPRSPCRWRVAPAVRSECHQGSRTLERWGRPGGARRREAADEAAVGCPTAPPAAPMATRSASCWSAARWPHPAHPEQLRARRPIPPPGRRRWAVDRCGSGAPAAADASGRRRRRRRPAAPREPHPSPPRSSRRDRPWSATSPDPAARRRPGGAAPRAPVREPATATRRPGATTSPAWGSRRSRRRRCPRRGGSSVRPGRAT